VNLREDLTDRRPRSSTEGRNGYNLGVGSSALHKRNRDRMARMAREKRDAGITLRRVDRRSDALQMTTAIRTSPSRQAAVRRDEELT
jgi:hypothetical protein